MPPITLKYKVPRSTYSRKTALQFKHVFDQALRERSPVFVPLAGSGYTLSSLRQKINDALLWLKDNYDGVPGDNHTREDYEHIKFFTQICVKEDGILVNYKDRITQSFAVDQGLPRPAVSNTWKDRVIRFLDSDEKILHIKGLLLSPDDNKWAEDRLSCLEDAEWTVTPYEIKVVK